MNKLQRRLWFFLTILFAISLTIYTLWDIVLRPWHILPEIGGDGAKNCFTYLYQCMYGKGFWFYGMNYPYGEHIVYTDGQPLLTLLLTSIKQFPPEQALPVLWWLIGLSYVLCIVYIYKILIHYRVGPLMAMIFAGLITVCSPQILRLQGHYALAYTCVIPMLFYWTIQYHERQKWKYCLYIFIAGTITAFLHPYFTAVMLLWTGSYAIGYFLFTKDALKAKLRKVAPLFGSVAGIFIVVAIVMKLTDPITDRPTTPYISNENYTHLKQILTSSRSPVWHMAKQKKLVWAPSEGGEGYTYIGIVAAVTMGIYLFILFVLLLKKRKENTLPVVFSPIWLFMAFSILLLGMGVPFIWHMEWLMNYLSIFKQFRSMGRFSWIFYYIITICTAVVLYRFFVYLKTKRLAIPGYAMLVISTALWGYEASGYMWYSRNLSISANYNYELIFSEREQNWQSYLADHHYKKDDFQAILLFQFLNVGTEKIWLGNSDWIITLGSKAAMQLHLPIVDAMLSRTSWSQAEKQVKIAAGPYVDKPLLHEIKSNKPFLLMHFDEDTLDADQQYLYAASDYIGFYSQCYVYACYPARILANDKRKADSIEQVLPYIGTTDTCITPGTGTWYVDHFNDHRAGETLFGPGAWPCIDRDDSLIGTIPVKINGSRQQYEFSCWFLLDDKDCRAPYVVLKQYDSAGRVISTHDVLTKKSVDNNGMWFRSAKEFTVKANCRMIKCRVVNTPRPSYKIMDEMMLRPVDAIIISKSADGKVMVNNHLFKK